MEAIGINDFNDNRIKENDVIKRILCGEKELYEILGRRNNQKLYRVIRGYLKDEAEIEDLMQNSPYVCVPKNQEESLTSLSQFKNKGNGKHCQTIGLFRYEHLYRTGHAFEELESDGTRRGHVLQDVLAGSGREDPVRIFKEEFS